MPEPETRPEQAGTHPARETVPGSAELQLGIDVPAAEIEPGAPGKRPPPRRSERAAPSPLYERLPAGLPGCELLRPRVHRDERGSFAKHFHEPSFAGLGLPTRWSEQFWSRSRPGVLRGMHFQTPPHAHDKLVTCLHGRVADAFVDLRRSSPSFGRHALVELDAERGDALLLPAGIAHGFYVPEGEAVMLYLVSAPYNQAHDAGLRWDACGVAWPLRGEPIVSARDRGFGALADFASPFP